MKPWLDLEPEVVAELLLPKGFIGEEERRSYHYIARHCCVGEGQIVDAGACLGASAFCFASGLARNAYRGSTRIHSFDRFSVGEDYVGDFITQHFRPSRGGDDFYDIFSFQIGQYKELIRSYRGDFLQESWDGSRIDILFVDLAKTPELHDHIVEQFYPCLVPGESLLMHQDFYHCWNPYIHITMQYLAHRFEVIDRLIPTNSRLFIVKDAITHSEIEHVRSFSKSERLELLDAFIDGEQGDLRAMARVTKLCQLWFDEDAKGYQDERQRLIAENGWRPDAPWGYQCNQLDRHMGLVAS